MADVGVIGAENIEALLDTNMEDNDGVPERNSFNSTCTELAEESVVMEDEESDKTEILLKVEDTTGPAEACPELKTSSEEVEKVEVKEEEKGETCGDALVKVDETSQDAAPKPAAAEIEVEDDIICLDDDEDGVSDSKRPRKTDDDVMEIDDILSKEEQESAGSVIRKMSRQDLEDLVLAKIVEAIVAHTEVGQLRAKVLELQLQKDKMANKMGIMLKQVAELSNAVNIITENEMRDPNNRVGKPHIIRFNRSVGLQTIIEPSVRSAPPKIIRVPESPQNIKQYGNTPAGKMHPPATNNGGFATPQSQPVKRVYQGSANKANDKVQTNPSPRKTYSASTGPPRMLPIAPKPPTSSVTITPAPAPSPIVDLTDDDPPTQTTNAQQNIQTPGGTTIINGVPYKILNRSATPSGGVQLVSPGGATGQNYIVSPSGSGTNLGRSVVLQPYALGTSQPQQQQVAYRGTNNNSVAIIPRPVAPRPNGNATRVAATVPVRPPTSVLGPATNTQRRFILPPLPPTPPAKGKNDFYKPPPKPELTLNEQADGIVLSWNLPTINNMAEVVTYQIFACQESLNNTTNRPSQWKRVGDVKALPLPMACTLSQFTEENRYYFIVRGVDVYSRTGPFCDPQKILLQRKNK